MNAKRLVTLLIALVVLAAAVAAYFAFFLNWSYSEGERAGWVQKFSRRGVICKTWEGELALVSMPGAPLEKFAFTTFDESVATRINALMGRRVSLRYEQRVGLPGSCFGDTRYYVTGIELVDEISISPGVVVQPPSEPASAPSEP